MLLEAFGILGIGIAPILGVWAGLSLRSEKTLKTVESC